MTRGQLLQSGLFIRLGIDKDRPAIGCPSIDCTAESLKCDNGLQADLNTCPICKCSDLIPLENTTCVSLCPERMNSRTALNPRDKSQRIQKGIPRAVSADTSQRQGKPRSSSSTSSAPGRDRTKRQSEPASGPIPAPPAWRPGFQRSSPPGGKYRGPARHRAAPRKPHPNPHWLTPAPPSVPLSAPSWPGYGC